MSGSFLALLGQVTGILLGMANNVLLARLLGPAHFGVYTILLKTCGIAEMVSQLGTNAVIVKLVGIAAGAEAWGRLKGILRSTFRIVLVSSAVMVLVIWLVKAPLAFKVFNSPELGQVLIFGVAIIPLQNGFLLVKETFRGLQDLKTASFLPVLQQLILFISLLFLSFKFITSIQNVIIALSAGFLCSLAAGLFILNKRAAHWLNAELVKPRSILVESLPMMVTRGSLLLISSMDVFVLGIYTDSAEVGVYSVVNSLATLTVFSLGIINQVIPAMIAHYNARKDFQTLSYAVRYASTLGALFSTPVLLLLLFLGKYILSVLFGPQYTSGHMALNFLVISQLVNSLTGSCGYMLQMTGLHMLYMKISLSCGILNLFLNITLVRYFGKEGVAAATAVTLVTQNLLVLIMAYKKTGIWTMASVQMVNEILKQARRYVCTLCSR